MIKNKSIITVVVIMILFFPYYGVSGESIDEIAAVVNNDIITLYDFNNAVKHYKETIRGQMRDSELKKNVLEMLIEEKLINQKAKELGISVKDEEVDSAIERFKKLNYLTDAQFTAALKKEGVSIEEYRDDIRKKILENRFVNYEVKSKIVISKEDVEAYYEKNIENKATDKSDSYVISNILVNDRKRAEYILKKIKEENISFENMAKEYSISPNGKNGGVLGSFHLNALSPDIKKAIDNLKQGDISGIVSTNEGFQIFYINNIENGNKKNLEDMYDEIEKELYSNKLQEKFKAWINNIKQESYVKIMI